VIKYGILDYMGKVVRWVWEKPADHYKYITVKIKRQRKPRLDLSTLPEAPL
jgi:hypothetical protein